MPELVGRALLLVQGLVLLQQTLDRSLLLEVEQKRALLLLEVEQERALLLVLGWTLLLLLLLLLHLYPLLYGVYEVKLQLRPMTSAGDRPFFLRSAGVRPLFLRSAGVRPLFLRSQP